MCASAHREDDLSGGAFLTPRSSAEDLFVRDLIGTHFLKAFDTNVLLYVVCQSDLFPAPYAFDDLADAIDINVRSHYFIFFLQNHLETVT